MYAPINGAPAADKTQQRRTTSELAMRYFAKPSFRAVLVEQSRYTVDKLRALRAERGVGPVSKIDPDVRATFKKV